MISNDQKCNSEDQERSAVEVGERLAALKAMKDEFVAITGHDLRAPLTTIREGVSLLRDGVLGPINNEQVEFLETINKNIDCLTELITNILDQLKEAIPEEYFSEQSWKNRADGVSRQ